MRKRGWKEKGVDRSKTEGEGLDKESGEGDRERKKIRRGGRKEKNATHHQICNRSSTLLTISSQHT